MNLPHLTDFDVFEKRAIVRMDFDVPEGDLSRIESSKATLDYLVKNKAKIILIGHKGRPEGKIDEKLSLASLAKDIEKIANTSADFVADIAGEKTQERVKNLANGNILILENLRFDPREENNDEEFAKALAFLGDLYVNEAFAVSHREHASIVGIPKFLPHAAGFRFEEEIKHLSKVVENPQRPLVFLISGIKEDKLEMIQEIEVIADKVLVAGRLPEYLQDNVEARNDKKLLIAQLNPDKEDITIRSIELFEEEINKAKTIVLAGVIGKYENVGQRLGTKRVFEAVANASAYKVAGGGDTEAALTTFNLTDKFDWISVGGGAMLEFLAKGTLPGIEALI